VSNGDVGRDRRAAASGVQRPRQDCSRDDWQPCFVVAQTSRGRRQQSRLARKL